LWRFDFICGRSSFVVFFPPSIEYIYILFFALPVNVEGVGWLLGYKVDGGNALSLFFLLLVELLSRLCDVVAAAAPQICG